MISELTTPLGRVFHSMTDARKFVRIAYSSAAGMQGSPDKAYPLRHRLTAHATGIGTEATLAGLTTRHPPPAAQQMLPGDPVTFISPEGSLCSFENTIVDLSSGKEDTLLMKPVKHNERDLCKTLMLKALRDNHTWCSSALKTACSSFLNIVLLNIQKKRTARMKVLADNENVKTNYTRIKAKPALSALTGTGSVLSPLLQASSVKSFVRR